MRRSIARGTKAARSRSTRRSRSRSATPDRAAVQRAAATRARGHLVTLRVALAQATSCRARPNDGHGPRPSPATRHRAGGSSRRLPRLRSALADAVDCAVRPDCYSSARRQRTLPCRRVPIEPEPTGRQPWRAREDSRNSQRFNRRTRCLSSAAPNPTGHPVCSFSRQHSVPETSSEAFPARLNTPRSRLEGTLVNGAGKWLTS